ncbi:MAG: biotin--[acetyl-CoA-carboxylase] ligase [Ruminococcus sp.]|nr:biotin--[acetyl-CoA-carboxylase] ligase [Ruminococcus sp.]
MNVKEIVISKLSMSGSEYISGAELARQIGVSRNAVWKAIKVLENEGYIIESVKAKGYRLSPQSNKLSAEIISANLTARELGKKIIILDKIDSTNNYAKEIASKGAVNGTVVIADTQTAGKGRLGRSFVSPSGKGLYMSVIIRPKFSTDIAVLITSAVAVASAEAVEKICGNNVQIKWVNDLYMNGQKICGILTEASMGMEINSPDYIVIGIGINVRESIFDDELSKRVSSIETETHKIIDRNELCALLLERLEYYTDNLENRCHLDEYKRRELLTGNIITANVGTEKITGRAIGVDENANLIIESESGEIRNLSSGEANLVRIKN